MCKKRFYFMTMRNVIILGVLLSLSVPPAWADRELATHNVAAETPQQRDARMAWWREARFGLFIHFGLFSLPVKESSGDVKEVANEYMARPIKEFRALADQFNPTQYDPDEWVRQAKAAGMKYVVFVTKSHDGWCLFDSKYTDFDVMSSPYKRDVLKPLTEACHREGIKFGCYYSIIDWDHSDYLPRRNLDGPPPKGADFDRYVTHMKNQLRELLTNYGPVDVLWFDGDWEHSTCTPELGKDLYRYVRSLRPEIIINERLRRPGDHRHRLSGDFDTPEGGPDMDLYLKRRLPYPTEDWEACMTMNDCWQYVEYDQNWKSTTTLIRRLVKCAGNGGNLLLDVGPKPDGTFPQPAVEGLEGIGRWMRKNSESIYGTTESPFAKRETSSLSWGDCTTRQLPDGQWRLYLHVYDWPQDGTLVVPELGNKVSTAYLLTDPQRSRLDVTGGDECVKIAVGQEAPDESVSVVVLGIVGAPKLISKIKLPTVIGDNMVLQRDMRVPIWGWAEKGEDITVTVAGQSVKAKAGEDGRWQVTLQELKVGDPLVMSIKGSSGSELTLKNILVGDVWVCSGQSNMEMPIGHLDGRYESKEDIRLAEIAAADYPDIRLFHIKKSAPGVSLPGWWFSRNGWEMGVWGFDAGQWAGCSPQTIAGFSAAGYYFGRYLHKELNVPIGLIQSACVSSSAELWTSRKVLEADPALKELAEQGSALYDGMIAPLMPYAIRGAIWYQGESNVSRAYQYRTLFPAMIKNWRDDWGQGQFPFGFVQLAPFRYGEHPACLAELWEAQLMTLNNIPNTGMIVTTDISNVQTANPKNQHPFNKLEVGRRLGLWAMATVYGKKDLVYSGPIYKSMKIEGERIRLMFDHTGGGLTTRDGKPPSHFTIAGADEKFVPAKVEIDGQTIVVYSDEVKQPIAVRFAWTDTAEPNLMNKEGLPASPFRTDTFKGVTEPK